MPSSLFSSLPSVGAWQLLGAYNGFEVAQFATSAKGTTITGTTLGDEDGTAWNLQYTIDVDESWRAIHAVIESKNGRRLKVQTDGDGRWAINGKHEPRLDGCLDIDLEGSVVTNTLPVHRLALAVGQRGDSSAVYVRVKELVVERLEQTYQRLPDAGDSFVFDYEAPRFEYHDHLRFAPDGLVIDYPNIAARVLSE